MLNSHFLILIYSMILLFLFSFSIWLVLFRHILSNKTGFLIGVFTLLPIILLLKNLNLLALIILGVYFKVITLLFLFVVMVFNFEYISKFSFKHLLWINKLELFFRFVFTTIGQFLYILLVGPFWGLFINYYSDKFLYKLSTYQLRPMKSSLPGAGLFLNDLFLRGPSYELTVNSAPAFSTRGYRFGPSGSMSAHVDGDLSDFRIFNWERSALRFNREGGMTSPAARHDFSWLRKDPPARRNNAPGSVMNSDSSIDENSTHEAVWVVDSPVALPVVIIEPAALPAVATPPPALPVPYEVPVSYVGYVEPVKMQSFFPPGWDMSYVYVWWHPDKWRKAPQSSTKDVTMEVVVNPSQQEVPASLPKNLTGESTIIEVENELDYLYLGDSEMILETTPCANNFFQLFCYIF